MILSLPSLENWSASTQQHDADHLKKKKNYLFSPLRKLSFSILCINDWWLHSSLFLFFMLFPKENRGKLQPCLPRKVLQLNEVARMQLLSSPRLKILTPLRYSSSQRFTSQKRLRKQFSLLMRRVPLAISLYPAQRHSATLLRPRLEDFTSYLLFPASFRYLI